MPNKFQLELIGTKSADTLNNKIFPGDAVTMYEFDDGMESSKYCHESRALDGVKGVYVTNAVEKQRLEETQLELYLGRMNNEES
jgi:hypothetical protein